MTTAYPLQWPEGWPRTPPGARKDGRGHFGKVERPSGRSWPSKRPLTFAEARNSLQAAARAIGGDGFILSTNFTLNSYGEPRGDRKRPEDQAVAVYFKRGGRDLVMARDAYTRAEENMRSLAMALEALAQMERHGGGTMMDKAFTGFAALPSRPKWWDILDVSPDASPATIRAAYRAAAKAATDETALRDLNMARDDAKAQREAEGVTWEA